MTRSECEIRLADAFEKLIEIYHEYNLDGKYLDVTYVDGYINIHNAHWHSGADADRVLAVSKDLETGEYT